MTRQTGNKKRAKHPLPPRQRTDLPLRPGEGRGEGKDVNQSEAQREILEVREGPAAPYLAKLQQSRHSREGRNPDTSSGWPRIPLGDLGRWRGGGTPSKVNLAFWTNGTIPWVSPKDMKTERIIRTEDYVTEDAVANSATRLIRKGAVIVVVRSGILKHSLPVAIADCDVTLNQDLKAVELKEGVLPEYTAWALRTFAPDILHRCAKTGTTVQNLEIPAFLRYEIPVPPLPQQHRIVAELETQLTRLDASVTALKRAQANLKRYRASVLKAACEGRLVPTEAELADGEGRSYESGTTLLTSIKVKRRQHCQPTGKNREPIEPDVRSPISVCKGWAIASIDQLCFHITSGSRDWSRLYGKGNGTFILAQNVRPLKLDLTKRQSVDAPPKDAETERTRVRLDDLLVTIVGAKTGDVCRVPIDLSEHYVCQSVALLRPVMRPIAKFFEIFLASPENGQATWKHYIYGQGRPHLSFEQLKMTPVPLPPLSEQHRIVAEVERRLSVIEELEVACTVNLKRATRLRQSILCKLFAGADVRRSAQQPN